MNDYDEILSGLKADNKYISSKYFYDDEGSKLFSEITELNEYYLTKTEIGIIKDNCDKLNNYIGKDYNIFEIGAGDGTKAELFIQCIDANSYSIVDISGKFIEDSIKRLKQKFINLNINGINKDFFDFPHMLRNIKDKKLVLFLGSTIGNFDKNSASKFLNDYYENMDANDIIVIGVDIKKDKNIIEKAYDDSIGVTAKFNLNILKNISKILGIDIPENKFEHRIKYDSNTGLLQMFLESKDNFSININGETIKFKKGELIHTENSFKYDINEFENMIKRSGFKDIKYLTDNNKYFSIFMGKKL